MADRERVLEELALALEWCSENDDPRGSVAVKIFAVRKALELLKEQQETIVSLQSTINKLTKALEEQTEQKHGHWVFDPDGMDWNIPAWRCSVCTCRNDNIPPNLEKTNPLRWSGSKFCPNCGAKMDEEAKQDETR